MTASLTLPPTATPDAKLFEQRVLALGGPPMQRTYAWIYSTYGAPVAVAWAVALTSDPRTAALYTARKTLAAAAYTTATPSAQASMQPLGGGAQDIAAKVDALEKQTLATILNRLHPADKKPTGSVRRAVQTVQAAPVVPEQVGYRDVPGQGGYVYRQYADGTITIIQSPRSKAQTTVDPKSNAYQAILQQIGPYPAGASTTTDALVKATQTAQQVAELLPKHGAGKVVGDVVKVGASAVGTAVAAQPVVAGLLAAAGVTGAAVPVAGWFVAGGLAVAAGITALVAALHGKGGRGHARQVAGRHKLPPELIELAERLRAMTSPQREALGAKWAEALRSGRVPPAKRKGLQSRLQVLATVELAQRAHARGRGHELERFADGPGPGVHGLEGLEAPPPWRGRRFGPPPPAWHMRPPPRPGLHPFIVPAPIPVFTPPMVCAPGAVREALGVVLRRRGIPFAAMTCRAMPGGESAIVVHVPENVPLDLHDVRYRGWLVVFARNAPTPHVEGNAASMAPPPPPPPPSVETNEDLVEVALGRAPFVLG